MQPNDDHNLGAHPSKFDLTQKPWPNTPSHMQGWEAFGTKLEDFTLRPLGLVTFRKPTKADPSSIVIKPYKDADVWPPSEVHDGVASIYLHTYGDDPTGVFIHVVGPEKEPVMNAWHRTFRIWGAMDDQFWPGEI